MPILHGDLFFFFFFLLNYYGIDYYHISPLPAIFKHSFLCFVFLFSIHSFQFLCKLRIKTYFIVIILMKDKRTFAFPHIFLILQVCIVFTVFLKRVLEILNHINNFIHTYMYISDQQTFTDYEDYYLHHTYILIVLA